MIRWPKCLQQTTSFAKESVYTNSSTTIRVLRVLFSEHGWCSTRWSKMLLRLSCRPQLQTSDTHRATGLSGRKQKRPQRTASNPYPPQRFFTWPEVQLLLGSPERWDDSCTGKRAGGLLTSPRLALPGSSQALTRLKRLHVQDADCVWCAYPTTNGTRRRAPSANQRQAAMSSRPHLPPLLPYAFAFEAAVG